tara:strand:+ start:7216 stop:9174 length:1959 start_codon:yes stop_codon:yes gene_type:complete
MVKKLKKKKTSAQTPAPKKDQIKGSKKNPKASASSSRGSIEVSEKTEKALKNLRDDHNKKYTSKSKQVDLGILKAVYRRGAGAFSTSHRPNVTSRDQWSLARVKAFLKLVGTGERKKSYNSDLDLLPKGHPQKKESNKLSIPQKYSHIDFTPPKQAQKNAEKALEERSKKPPSQRGMTNTGIARARDIKNGKSLTPETIKRMLSYFQRHEVDKTSSSWNDYGKGRQAWNGWGGDAAYSWVKSVKSKMDKADDKLNSLSELIHLGDIEKYEKLDNGLIKGKPFKTLSIGQVSSRLSGENIGRSIDLKMLKELKRVFDSTKESDPVVIDWNHSSSPFNNDSIAPPEVSNLLGQIIEVEVKPDGLYVTPAYNNRGLSIVKSAEGLLWSSPEYQDGEVFSRSGGSKIGEAQLLAVTLTPRPAQSQNKIDPITLSEKSEFKENSMNEDDLKELEKEALVSMVKELQSQIEEMKVQNKVAKDLDTKKELAEAENDKEKMNELEEKEKEKEKMTEKDKHYKMSESDYNKINSLNEKLVSLNEQVKKLTIENNQIKEDEAINRLLSEGKITPAQEKIAREAFTVKDLHPVFWEDLNNRPTNSEVNFSAVGHSSHSEEITKHSIDKKISLLSEEKNIPYGEALTLFRLQNKEEYAQAMKRG